MRRALASSLLCLVVIGASAVAGALPTCGTTCTSNGDCVLSQDGCSVCRVGVCSPQCGAQCSKDSDCGLIPGDAAAAQVAATSQCFVCYFNQCGSQYCGAQCNDDSQCASNPLCKVCTKGACSPPPTPAPSVPPTPQPPTPPPTPAPGKAAWGAVYCAGSNCGTNSYFNFGATLAQAESIAYQTTPTNNGDYTPYFYAAWTQPLPCAALVLSSDFDAFFVNSTDIGTATTSAVSQCRNAGHSTCFVNFAACAEYPPPGSRWGGIATAGGPESLGTVQLDTLNGTGYDTWEDALNATMNDCNNNNGGGCGLTAVFYNCMAFATQPNHAASVNFANSLSAAENAALQGCYFESEGSGGCTIASSACISPFHMSKDDTVTGGRTWRFNHRTQSWIKKN